MLSEAKDLLVLLTNWYRGNPSPLPPDLLESSSYGVTVR